MLMVDKKVNDQNTKSAAVKVKDFFSCIQKRGELSSAKVLFTLK
jgi:hypothetical protein